MNLDEIDVRILNALQSNAAQNNQDIAALAFVSPPTAMRRIKRLRESGVIEKEVALLQDQMGLIVFCEVTLDAQNEEAFNAFEAHVCPHIEAQQCYRTSGACDFVLVLRCVDMGDFQALSQTLFTQHANVRNIKHFFATKRVKFEPRVKIKKVATI